MSGQANVCFRDCDNATRPALTAALVYLGASCVGAAACSRPEPACLSKHHAARGSLVLRFAKQDCFCLDASSELHRVPDHRGDTAISRPTTRRVVLVRSGNLTFDARFAGGKENSPADPPGHCIAGKREYPTRGPEWPMGVCGYPGLIASVIEHVV